jgi:putative DNA primase/helicase
MIILSAKPVAPNRATNPNIADEIIAEKSGILNWMFAGLQRLLANNYKFSLSERARLNAAEMSQDNCNIIEFLATVQFSENAETSSAVLYGSYANWCEVNALTAIKREPFVTWLKANRRQYNVRYSTNIVTANGGFVRGFKGISA